MLSIITMATQQVVVVSNSTTANQSTATKNYPVVIKPLNLEGGQWYVIKINVYLDT